ncbi:MAG: DUF1365 domain-containing protein [Hyphomicrobiales bacterium]
MHARLKPMGHRFSYRVYSFLLDLDDLASATKSALFSHNRFNLFSFYDKDHGAADGSSLRAYIDELLRHADHEKPTRIELLCYPRILGWVFNPLSVYYCYDDQDQLSALVYEVRNTFGERHTYVAPIRKGEMSHGRIRQERDKLFYVSPFIDMKMRYHFRMTPPAEGLTLRILEHDDEGPLLSATFSGTRSALSTSTLLKAFFQVPFQTLKIVGGIHWEALKLWKKGAQFHMRPARPESVSYSDKPDATDAPASF